MSENNGWIENVASNGAELRGGLDRCVCRHRAKQNGWVSAHPLHPSTAAIGMLVMLCSSVIYLCFFFVNYLFGIEMALDFCSGLSDENT